MEKASDMEIRQNGYWLHKLDITMLHRLCKQCQTLDLVGQHLLLAMRMAQEHRCPLVAPRFKPAVPCLHLPLFKTKILQGSLLNHYHLRRQAYLHVRLLLALAGLLDFQVSDLHRLDSLHQLRPMLTPAADDGKMLM